MYATEVEIQGFADKAVFFKPLGMMSFSEVSLSEQQLLNELQPQDIIIADAPAGDTLLPNMRRSLGINLQIPIKKSPHPLFGADMGLEAEHYSAFSIMDYIEAFKRLCYHSLPNNSGPPFVQITWKSETGESEVFVGRLKRIDLKIMEMTAAGSPSEALLDVLFVAI